MVKILNQPSSNIIDDAELVAVPEGYWKNLGEATTGAPETREIAQAALRDNGDLLAVIVTESLEAIREVIALDPNDYDDAEIRMKVISMKSNAAQGMINAGLKSDENRFRRENKDLLSELFARIEAEKKGIIIENQPSVPSLSLP
jgi:hypothetical protein